MVSTPRLAPETLAIHGGNQIDGVHRAVMPPITTATSFVQPNLEEYGEFCYSRVKNPTRAAYESALADLETVGQGGVAVATASGLAAIALVIDLVPSGSAVVVMAGVYGGTYRLFEDVKRQSNGLRFFHVDFGGGGAPSDPLAGLRAKILEVQPAMVWIETPTNPLLKLVDILAVRTVIDECQETIQRMIKAGSVSVKQRGTSQEAPGHILLAVDNTFCTGYLQQPLLLGADISVLSTSKYVGGHSDMIGGAVVVRGDNAPLADRIVFLNKALGSVAGPFDCYLALRGMKTLCVRLDRQAENALAVAKFLKGHEKVYECHYPLLGKQVELCRRQMRSGGCVVTVGVVLHGNILCSCVGVLVSAVVFVHFSALRKVVFVDHLTAAQGRLRNRGPKETFPFVCFPCTSMVQHC